MPGPRPATGKEQGAARVLAEPAREQGRRRQPTDDQVLDLVRVGEEQSLDAVERRVALGKPDGDPVVGPDRLDLEAQPLADPRLERQRPWRVDPAPERRQETEPPVPQLVAEALAAALGEPPVSYVADAAVELLGKKVPPRMCARPS